MTPFEEALIQYLFISFAFVVTAVVVSHLLGVHSSRKDDDADQTAYLDKYADIKRLRKQAKALRH